MEDFVYLDEESLDDVCGINVDELWQPHELVGAVAIRPYVPGEYVEDYIALSKQDDDNGSPQLGDMIVKDFQGRQRLINKLEYRQFYRMITKEEIEGGSAFVEPQDVILKC